MDLWEYDCPQFVDFSAPHPLDVETDFFEKYDADGHLVVSHTEEQPIVSNAAPANIFSSLSDWRKTDNTTTQNQGNKPRPRTTRSLCNKLPDNNNKDSKESTNEVEKKAGTFAQPAEKRLPSRSLKRSHSFTKTPGQQDADSASPAPKSLKHTSTTASPAAPRRTLKRASSSSQISATKPIKRCSSFSKIHQAGRSGARSRSPAAQGKLLCSKSRSPMTRSRSSSIGAQPLRTRTASASRERLRSLGKHSSASVDNLANCSTISSSSAPSFTSRRKFRSDNNKIKTTEELELEQVEQKKREIEERRKRNELSYKKALAPAAFVPIFPAKSTKAEGFHFRTDSRIKTHKMETRNDEKDFVHSLRSNSQAQKPVTATCGITVVKPFNLTETKKKKTDDAQAGDKFLSMAERVTAFHRQTPERFRTKLKGPLTRARSKSPPKLTIPKTPSFETRSRSRPVTAPSREELEAMEIEEIRNNQFKAHPLNPKVFSNPELGLKKVESKPVTQPEEFSLTSDHRSKAKGPANSSVEENKFEFHARPVPSKILEQVVGVKPLILLPVTVPQSPAFALKHRARIPRVHPDEEEEDHAPTRRPHVPHTGIPFQPKLPHKQAVVEPFSFERRDKERLAKKEEKIKQLKEEASKVPRFHANPIPDSVVTGEIALPIKQPKPPTIPEPFKLEADRRGKIRLEEFKQKVEEERQCEKEKVVFKAHEPTAIHQKPFMPKKSNKPLVDITEFELNTERRAQERDAFEQKKKQRQAHIQAYCRQEEQRKEDEDREAISRLRHEMVHRANPIRQYKAVAVHHSNKPLTTPHTPDLSTAKIRRMRPSSANSSA